MNDTSIEKKKKGKPPMQRWRLFRWVGGFLVIGVVVTIILAILGPSIGGNGQITQTALDSEYVATAEYLLKNPLPTPEGFPAHLNVEQDTWGFRNESENVEVFCVQGFVPHDIHITVEFNQYPVRGGFSRSLSGLRDDSGRILSHCIGGTVETGLHLLSVEMSSDAWNDQTYNYTWAIEITNDGYQYMPNYPFHNESD